MSNNNGNNGDAPKRKNRGCLVWFIATIGFGTLLQLTVVDKTGQNEADIPLLLLGILLGFLVFCIYMARYTSKQRKQMKNAAAEEKALKGYLEQMKCKHTSGLPIAENSECMFIYYPDKITIESGGTEFSLLASRIRDISITTDIEIQKAYVSSVGGAVGGAVLFGPLGAMIGGRAKEKENKIVKTYLIVTYEKEEEIKYVGFELDGLSGISAKKICAIFQSTYSGENKKVEL